MLGTPASARSDHRYVHCFGYRRGDLEIVTVLRAVGVHAGQYDFAGAAVHHLLRPFKGLEARRTAASVGVDLENRPAVTLHPLGVYVDHRGTPAEPASSLTDDVRVFDCGRVDAYLLGTGLDQLCHILDRADSAAYRKRHEALLSHLPDNIEHDLSVFVACGYVQKDQLVGTRFVIPAGNLHRVARVAQLNEIHALNYATGLDIKTRYDSVCKQDSYCNRNSHAATRMVREPVRLPRGLWSSA